MIIGLGALLRFLLLAIKPPHFDEGINGWFVDQMVKNGFYKYDPTNYHGPLHFYVEFLFQTLLGRNVWALRLPVALVSTLCVWLTLKFEPFVGRPAARVAAIAMAVSPGFVFYGRYSIHEVWLVLFSMLFVLGLLGLWKFGTSNYLWCAGMGLAGMILTKETYIIHVGCAVIAAGVCYVSNSLSRVPDARPARQTWSYIDLAVTCGVAIAVIVFFYSGTFFHWHGVKDIFNAYAAWFQTGHEGHGHEKPWYYWLKLMAPSFQFSRADFPGLRIAGAGRINSLRFLPAIQKHQLALSGHLRRRHTDGLQHRPLQNALVHYQHHLAVPVPVWRGFVLVNRNIRRRLLLAGAAVFCAESGIRVVVLPHSVRAINRLPAIDNLAELFSTARPTLSRTFTSRPTTTSTN